MKRLSKFAPVMTLIGILMVAASCGSNNSAPLSTTNSALVGGVTQLPGGAVSISFTGTNIYNSGIHLSGGPVTGGTSGAFTYCGSFSIGSGCWLFSNSSDINGSGQVIPGGVGAGLTTPGYAGGIPGYGAYPGYGAPGYGAYPGYSGYPGIAGNALQASSKYEPGSTMVIIPTGSSLDYYHQNVTGTLILSPLFVQRNFIGGALPPVIGLAFDFIFTGNQITSGGVLIYNSRDASGIFHGVFLDF